MAPASAALEKGGQLTAIDIHGLGHLINGKVVRNSATFPVDSPATGQVFAECPDATEDLLNEAVDAAAAAQPEWAALGVAGRQKVIGAMAAALQERIADIVELSALEKGTLRGSMEAYVGPYYMNHSANCEVPVDVIEDTEERSVVLVRKPIGVVAAIAPWNAPVLIICEKIANALLLGNTVVAKPSPFTSFATLALGELWKDIVPPGVLNIIAGGNDVGAALVSHPKVGMVSFTGSVNAGKHIAQSAAASLKRVVLELGGNDAAIVLPDVDVANVAKRIYDVAFLMSGQTCASIKRVYAHRDVYQDLVVELSRLAAEANKRQGGEDPGLDPLTTHPQYDRVKEILDDALALGAHADEGGTVPEVDGYYLPATILTNVTNEMKVVKEEQFGPLLPVIPFDDVSEAVAAANATEFGLCGSVWTSDIEEGARIASQLECGTSLVNSHAEVAPHIAFGGAKSSGIGRSGGVPGLDGYAELQTQYVYKSADRVKAS